MKQFVPAVLAAAVLALPIGALAGETSAPGMHGPMMMIGPMQDLNLTTAQRQAMDQVMEQSRAQMDALHSQARLSILGALTPAHRALLAQVVGSLATAPNPDESAAIRQLDAALSPGEARTILSMHAAVEQQGHALMEAVHGKVMSILTASQRAQLESQPHGMMHVEGPGGPGGHEMGETPLTAGSILLHLSAGHDVMFFHAETQHE